MILADVVSAHGCVDRSRCSYINDLRQVVARFMGRDEPGHDASDPVVQAAWMRHGQWLTLDGGALRLRVYLNGNAHLEVHPEMAARLNAVLAWLHPSAIPTEFRRRPRKPAQGFGVLRQPLPFAVLALLAELCESSRDNTRRLPRRCGNVAPAVRRRVVQVLKAIGGVPLAGCRGGFQFADDPTQTLQEIVASGCIPDRQASPPTGIPGAFGPAIP